MAPMGWQVLAGLMVRAVRSLISFGVCLSNMTCIGFLISSTWRRGDAAGGWSRPYKILFAGVFGGQFGALLPGGLQILPDLAVHHAVDFPVEVDGALETGVRAAVVVAVELLAGMPLFWMTYFSLMPAQKMAGL